jgi:phage-related protein
MDIFENAVKPMMKVLTPIVKILGDLLQGMLIPALNMIMEPIQEITKLMESMLPAGASLGDTFKTIGKIIGPLILVPFRAVFFVIDMIKENLKGITDVFSGIGDMLNGNILDGLKKIGMGIMRAVLSPIQAIVDLAIGLVNNIIEGLNNVPGVSLPLIPKFNMTDAVFMAEGGITTGPTKAIIGEAGPEAVIPLTKFYEKIDELISVVKQGGNIYLDGTRVGTAMNVSTYKVQ